VEKMLRDYNYLNNQLHTLTEAELRSMLNYELSTKKRKVYLERLHQRYCKLRDIRERQEIFAGGML